MFHSFYLILFTAQTIHLSAAPNVPDNQQIQSSYNLKNHLQNFKTDLVQNLTNFLKKEVVGELSHLIKKESARQMVGLTRIADHLQIDEATEDIDCFPIMTDEALSSFEVQLKENKMFQAQVVSTFI